MDDVMIKVPLKEWEEMNDKIKELTEKVEIIYTREYEYVSMSELSEWLHCSRTTLWRMRADKKFKTYLIGGKIMASKTEIQTLLNEGKL